MRHTLLLTLILSTLILTGLSCDFFGFGEKEETQESTQGTQQQPTDAGTEATQQGFVPPPPDVISEFEQEGYTDEEKDYLNSIRTAPNPGSDPLREELGF